MPEYFIREEGAGKKKVKVLASHEYGKVGIVVRREPVGSDAPKETKEEILDEVITISKVNGIRVYGITGGK